MRLGFRRIVEELFRLSMELRASPSTFGNMLERAKLGTTERPDEWTLHERTEERYARYALLLQLWNKLTPTERLVMALAHLPSGEAEYLRVVHKSELVPLYVPLSGDEGGGACNAKKADGTRCQNPRKPGEARCHIPSHQKQQSPVLTWVTPPPRSEELVCRATPPRMEVVDRAELESVTTFDDAAPRARTEEEIEQFLTERDKTVPQTDYEDLRLVRGRRATYMRPDEVAEQINRWMEDAESIERARGGVVVCAPRVSPRQVRRWKANAEAKWMESPQLRLVEE